MRWIVALAAASVTGCASIGAPPGGPPRTTPPVILSITPDSGAVNVRGQSVIFAFDVVVSDRAPGGELDNLFLLSPEEGRPRVRWRRDRIEVRPRRGFRANTTYSITLLPGLADLRGNVMKTGKTVIFSTGPTIPPYSVFGRVFDWLGERTAPRALVEVIRRPDSLRFVGAADSTGQFSVGPLDVGQYTVRAILDNNNNRGLDPGEPWDSVAVTVGGGASPFVELLAIPRDTVPPRLLTVSVRDSVSMTATFDKALNPELTIVPESFRIVSSDSAPLRVVRVLTRAQSDSLQKAAQDSAARVRDDSVARADTSRARADTVRPPPPAAGQPDTARLGGRVVAPQPKPSRPPPPRELNVQVDSRTPFVPGKSYRVTVKDVRGLLGPARATERVIILPRARPDSLRPTQPPPPRVTPPAPTRRPP